MTRNEMLNALHNIHVAVSLVALPSEGALECTCVTPKGSSYEWFDLYDWDWPAYRINLPGEAVLRSILEKVAQKKLTLSDIEETEFKSLYLDCIDSDEDCDEKLNAYFSDLLALENVGNDTVYVLNTGNSAQFFNDYAGLEKAFTEFWSVTPWEECSDDALREMLDQIENDFDEMPLGYFGEDDV